MVPGIHEIAIVLIVGVAVFGLYKYPSIAGQLGSATGAAEQKTKKSTETLREEIAEGDGIVGHVEDQQETQLDEQESDTDQSKQSRAITESQSEDQERADVRQAEPSTSTTESARDDPKQEPVSDQQPNSVVNAGTAKTHDSTTHKEEAERHENTQPDGGPEDHSNRTVDNEQSSGDDPVNAQSNINIGGAHPYSSTGADDNQRESNTNQEPTDSDQGITEEDSTENIGSESESEFEFGQSLADPSRQRGASSEFVQKTQDDTDVADKPADSNPFTSGDDPFNSGGTDSNDDTGSDHVTKQGEEAVIEVAWDTDEDPHE